MRHRFACLAVIFGLAGCSHNTAQNTAQLATDADPKVCASSEVEDTLLQMMKEHLIGSSTGLIADAGVTGKQVIDAVTLKASEITSKSVDKNAQTVDCNATINSTAAGISDAVESSVDYEVKPDLSDAGKIIVSVSHPEAFYGVDSIEEKLLSAKRAEQDAQKEAQRQKQLVVDNPAAAGDPALTSHDFAPEEKALIAKDDGLNDSCRGAHPETCDQRDQVTGLLKGRGVCWGPDDAIEADKHWMRCEESDAERRKRLSDYMTPNH